MARRILCVLALVAVSLATAVAGSSPAGAQTAELSTSPMFAPPGGSLTIQGPALTCPAGADDQLVISSEAMSASVNPVQGEAIAIEAQLATVAPDSYEMIASCLSYNGGSTTVASGWITITGPDGLPPSDGTATVSVTQTVQGQEFTVYGEGFAPGSGGQTWMYSDPVLLGSFTASATGSVVSQVAVPTGTAVGSHTVVLAGTSASGKPTFLTVGLVVGEAAGGGTTTTTVAPSSGSPTAATATTQPSSTGAGNQAATGNQSANSGARATTTTTGTLPRTGGGIGLALPAAGLVGFGSVLALLARWRERLATGHT